MEKYRNISYKDRFLKIGRGMILATALLTPFSLDVKKIEADPQFDGAPVALITGYYCKKLVGYQGYDNGGFCGSPALGGITISGETAGCGSNFRPHDRLLIEGYPKVIICNDTGRLAPNQIDIYHDTDRELHDAGFPRFARVLVVNS